MLTILFTLLVSTLPAAAASTANPPAAAPVPITSRAQLHAYLRDTPLSQSPLRFLSPGGRKRFLGRLQFGNGGLSSVPYAEPAAQMTHAQIVKLFTLFDVQQYARGLGISPAQRAQRLRERAQAAEARGCRVGHCPPTTIEQHFNDLVLYGPARSLPLPARAKQIAHQYDRLFAQYQTAKSLTAASDPDLRLLKRAAQYVLFYAKNQQYVAQLQADLAQMQRRGMTTARSYAGLYHALVATRQFARARTLRQQHPGLDVAPLPAFHKPTELPPGQPTALAISSDGDTMTRRAFNLDAPLRIVIVASCHFSQDAARAVAARPALRKLFHHHAIWLANSSESILAARQWNRQFPRQPIYIAWNDKEWSMLNSWAMPTFYVFRHGKLVDQWAGWPNGSTALATLQKHLHDDGVLPN